MARPEGGEDRRNDLQADELRHAEPHRSGDLAGWRGPGAQERRMGEGHRARLREQRMGGLRRNQSGGRTREEDRPERPLQLLHVAAHGRLREPQHPRGG